MKVLILNGSPRKNGNTARALEEMALIFKESGVEYEILPVGSMNIRGCIACDSCQKTAKCVFDDEVNIAAEKLKECDGLVIASPVYFASANGTLISFLDRLFESTQFDKTMKVGASVVICRRGGASSTFDELNKYFTISNMPIVSSQYWNSVHGLTEGEAEMDIEGLQTMRTLARNMVFLMKAIQLGREKFGLPQKEIKTPTHFIR